MQLNPQAIQDLNLIAAWLALDDMPAEGDIEADMAILAGHAVLPNIEGAVALAKKIRAASAAQRRHRPRHRRAGAGDGAASALSRYRDARQKRGADAGGDRPRFRRP
ncbi:hypothetical protein OJE16_10455 [Pantoea tagorei]